MRKRLTLCIATIGLLLLPAWSFAGDVRWRTSFNEATSLCQSGEWAEAYQQASQALKLAQAKFGTDHLNTAKSLEVLADISMYRGRLQQADLYLDRALRIRAELLGENHPTVVRLLTTKGNNFRLHRQYDSAEKWYLQALNRADKGGEGDSLEAPEAMEGLAAIYLDQKEYSRAEPLFRKAVSIYELRQKYGNAEKMALARCLVAQGDLMRATKDFSQAHRLYEAALNKYSNANGPTTPMIAVICKRLADLYVDQKVPNLAVAYAQRALGAYYRTGMPDGLLTAATLSGLAGLLNSKGNNSKATNVYSVAEAIAERTGLHKDLATMTLMNRAMWPSLTRK